MAHEAGFLTKEFMDLHHKNIGVAQYDHTDYGWWTDNAAKVKYGYKTRELMMLGCVTFMQDWICINPWIKADERKRSTLSKFTEQVKRYRPVATTPSEPHSTGRITLSGKVDKDGKISGTFKDDIMVALTMNLYLWEELSLRRVPNFNYKAVFG
jgi:hypothetical protein